MAILDSGVSCEHVDLDTKCVEQVNFVADHGSPVNDIIGHGTHVAAIAAAETDNGIGTAGVAPQATIGSLKVCYEDYTLELLGIIQGICEDADVAEAIVYAADNGYHVINMSLAGPQHSEALDSAVNYAWENGVVIVAAAGNDYSTERLYPAACENVISVAATDYYDNLAYFSNFSTESDDWVSVAAPGHTIFSAVPGDQCGVAPNDPQGCYDWKTGTSMSSPFVSGIAALLWSYLGNPNNAQIRSIIENSADKAGAMGQNLLAWTKNGRVNLYKALLAAESITNDIPLPDDYDGDSISDTAVWRPENGMWVIHPSIDPGSEINIQWGLSSDIPVPRDYDGDGKADIAVWRPGDGVWYVLPSNDPGTYISIQWGLSSDIPVPRDYDGDSKADIAVWRPGDGVWFVLTSSAPGTYLSIQWGSSSDTPVPGDYDGDDKGDIAVWRPDNGSWFVLPSSDPGSYTATIWGGTDDKPVSGDFDGDGKRDIAVWRPGNGTWYVLPSSKPGTYISIQWGLSSDIPVPGDYDGDGMYDIAVWRPSDGLWYILPSSNPGAFISTM